MDPSDFIDPKEMDNDDLLYWATLQAKRYIQAQERLTEAQSLHESFLAEIIDREMLNDLMENLDG